MGHTVEIVRRYAVSAMFLGLGSVTIVLGVVDRKLIPAGLHVPHEILWGVACATAILYELTLILVCGMLVGWKPRNCIGLVFLASTLYAPWYLTGNDDELLFLSVAAATALLALPARLGVKRFVRLADAQPRSSPGSAHSLSEWFLSIAVIAIWIVTVPNLSSTTGDQWFFVAISLSTFFGVILVLGNLPLRISAPLYALILCGFGVGAMLYLGESLGTMNWSAPPVHGELSPISSPIKFITTRFAHLQYFDVLDVSIVWFATLSVIETITLATLRFAGYRIVYLGKPADQAELKA